MISLSHWGMFNHPDGIPVSWEEFRNQYQSRMPGVYWQFREEALANLKIWADRR